MVTYNKAMNIGFHHLAIDMNSHAYKINTLIGYLCLYNLTLTALGPF